MIAAPILSAGRGWRALATTAAIELAVVLAVFLMNFATLADALVHWRTDGLMIFPFVVLFVFPVALGALVVYVKNKEDRQATSTICRQCGYDLRATPERCPECGTFVRQNPERF